jgi:hypothetical protein
MEPLGAARARVFAHVGDPKEGLWNNWEQLVQECLPMWVTPRKDDGTIGSSSCSWDVQDWSHNT